MFYLLGPTAIGKSDLAAAAALRCGAEIIGADAFQVYTGLDILTAKPSATLLSAAPHHLIGEIPLSQPFDAAQYRQLALSRARDIESRDRLVIIAGGTGLYIRALTHGLSDMPRTDPALRASLDSLPVAELQRRYSALDPAGYEKIDLQNPRRLIRAIEVCLLTGKPFSAQRADWSGTLPPAPATHGVILERTREDLYSRIDQRVRQMFDQGVVDEVRESPIPGSTAAQAIGYSEIRAFLCGEISQPDCIAAIQQRTRQYAKRQLTWLRRANNFPRLNLT